MLRFGGSAKLETVEVDKQHVNFGWLRGRWVTSVRSVVGRHDNHARA